MLYAYTYILLTDCGKEYPIDVTVLLESDRVVRDVYYMCSCDALLEITDINKFSMHLADTALQELKAERIKDGERILRKALHKRKMFIEISTCLLIVLFFFI